eukprot:TRINITY_DN1973_c0_g1_i1.p2 TRINITY_DN1973_c0_g1~~TRINITY_DN1973_c0_g1_i1.p2  ORF type:complete len:123 (+),score=59.78 TRINITY_DN1973_c0_g1_i1:69-437(+)
MGSAGVDVMALAVRYQDLRAARQDQELYDELFHKDTEMVIPGIFSDDKLSGRSKILKQWKKDDEGVDAGTVVVKRMTEWKVVKPMVIARTVYTKAFFLNFDIHFSLHFNSKGKLDKVLLKKL